MYFSEGDYMSDLSVKRKSEIVYRHFTRKI